MAAFTLQDAIEIVAPPATKPARVIRLYNRDWTRCLEIPDSEAACAAIDAARKFGIVTSLAYEPATRTVRAGLIPTLGDIDAAVAFIRADFAEHVAAVKASRDAMYAAQAGLKAVA